MGFHEFIYKLEVPDFLRFDLKDFLVGFVDKVDSFFQIFLDRILRQKRSIVNGFVVKKSLRKIHKFLAPSLLHTQRYVGHSEIFLGE